MKILAIESSTKNFSLAVCEGEKILVSRNMVLRHVLSSSIVPAIRTVLKRAGLSLHDCDAFAVGLGPGSFTSLRVGLSTVKGLAFATQKPVIGIPSLDTLAANGYDEDVRQICVICDARRDRVFGCVYRKETDIWQRVTEHLLVRPEELLTMVDGAALFIGDGIALYREIIFQKAEAQLAPEKLWYPRASRMIPVAIQRLRYQQFDDLDQLVPLYLYPQDCQVKRLP
jgi:tRNA threonylcarbamoyladenosine biosynthesis protein TsaB